MNFIRKYWMGICSPLAIGITGFFLFQSLIGSYLDPAGFMGRVSAKSLIFSVVGFLAATSLRKRWKKKKLEFWIFCLAISFSLIASSSIYVINDSKKVSNQTRQMNNADRELVRLFRDVVNDQSPQAFAKEYTSEEYGDFSEIMSMIQPSFGFFEQMSSTMNAAYNSFNNMVTPAILCESENILLAKELLGNFVDTIDTCEKKYKEELDMMEGKLREGFWKDERAKQGAIAGFEHSRSEMIQFMSEFFLLARESATRTHDLLDFLTMKVGNFCDSNGTFLFYNDEDGDTFDLLVQKICEKEDMIAEKLEKNKQMMLKKLQALEENLE